MGLFLYSVPSKPFSGDLHVQSTHRSGVRSRRCSRRVPPPAPKPATAAPRRSRPAPQLKSGLDLAGFDRSVRPQDDLYRFVGGGWLAQHRDSGGSLQLRLVQHPRRPGAGRGEAAHRRGVHAGQPARRVRTRRKSATSTSPTWTPRASESLGISPLKDELARIDAIATPRDVARYIGYSQRIGVAQPFAWFSAPDSKNSTRLSRRALPERAHHARPRLLPFSRREVRAVPREVRRVRRTDAGARRRARCEVRCRAHRGARDAHRQLPVDQGAEPRSGEDLQPDDVARVPEAGAGLRLDGVLRRHGRAGAASRREPAVVHQGHRPAGEDRAGVRLARVFQVPVARRLRAGVVGAVRRPRIRISIRRL